MACPNTWVTTEEKKSSLSSLCPTGPYKCFLLSVARNVTKQCKGVRWGDTKSDRGRNDFNESESWGGDNMFCLPLFIFVNTEDSTITEPSKDLDGL